MRVLWIAPWGRALARVYLDEMVRQGHEVLLVTTTKHFEKSHLARYERFISGAPKNPRSWPSAFAADSAARRLRPDVVVADQFYDPRLLPMTRLAPLATIVHDDRPHDPAEREAWHHRQVVRRLTDRADLLLTFSEHVATAIGAHLRTPIATVALPSDAPEALVPPVVPAEQRRDFVLVGRIGPYKNVPLTVQAWQRHVASPAYRGDRLIILGDGSEEAVGPLPESVEWRREPYQFAEMMPVLARAKASLAYYRLATQSGVQVISMQCATPVLAADTGGLPEYLPPGEMPVPVDDPAALAAAFDRLADPARAAAQGRAGRAYYDAVHHPTPATAQLLDVLGRLATSKESA